MTATKSILYLLSAGEGRSDGLQRAIEQAHVTGAAVTLLRVVESVPRLVTRLLPGGRDLEPLLVEHAEGELRDVADQLAAERVPVRWRVRRGKPAHEVTLDVMESGHDLVMKQARGEDGLLLGSTARQLIRSCPCAVWVVKPGTRRRHVVAAVDPLGDGPLQHRIVAEARQLAWQTGAQLTLAHAWELPSAHLLASRMREDEFEQLMVQARADARARLEQLADETPWALRDERLVLLEGHHGPMILELLRAQRPDLLVLGSLSRTGVAGLLVGNTAERVLSGVDCSVLVLKPEGFTAPRLQPPAEPALAAP